MKDGILNRPMTLGEYMLENKATVRSCAAHFGLSKSTVHKDVTQKLAKTDKGMFLKVQELMDINKSERHIRGGEATKKKYAAERGKK